MNASSIQADKMQWLTSESRRVIDEINMYKKKQAELELKIRELANYLNNRRNQLDIIRKRCEETSLQIIETTATEKRILAIHELEKSRYSKLRKAVEEYKAAISGGIRRQRTKSCQANGQLLSPNVTFSNQLSYVNCSRELQLDERKRCLDVLKRTLAKREQDMVIKKNYNTARIIRLRKLLQANEAKRGMCKEQLIALKSKHNRRY